MDAPFRLERTADGAAVLIAIPEDGGGEPVRVRLDDAAMRALRDAVDAAVARASSGGEGAVAEFRADGANVIVIAVPGGSVRLRVER